MRRWTQLVVEAAASGKGKLPNCTGVRFGHQKKRAAPWGDHGAVIKQGTFGTSWAAEAGRKGVDAGTKALEIVEQVGEIDDQHRRTAVHELLVLPSGRGGRWVEDRGSRSQRAS